MTAVAAARTSIDSVLGRVTMYRLVVLCLGVLTAISMIAAATGSLAYGLEALLAVLGVLLVSVYLSNRLFAALFRVRPHSESSIITALLLYFILQPSTDLTVLAQVALAGLFASASKYLLAYRGRHIFNPAAVGAVWLSVVHVYIAFWWVGTPVMLPFAAVLALVVLYRTRRLPMAAVFIAVAGAILLVRGISDGGSVADALRSAFAQSPLVFFAGFMLSEPLTLPAARWQQWSLAGVVGVLFALPISSTGIEFGPEAALIVGNVLAFGFSRRRGIDLVLTGKRAVSASSTEFAFRPARRLSFRAGQFLELGLPHSGADSRGLRRSFSISSPPRQPDDLRIAVKIPERSSTFKAALAELEPGAVVTATGISGDFVLPRDPAIPLLLIAGGIGITPFASQLDDIQPAEGRDIVLIYLVSETGPPAYVDVITRSVARAVIVTGTPEEPPPAGVEMVKARRLTDELLSDVVPDLRRRTVFVSGPPGLVTEVSAAARRLGARRIRRDYFTGY